jgi:hypothetical protein
MTDDEQYETEMAELEGLAQQVMEGVANADQETTRRLLLSERFQRPGVA